MHEYISICGGNQNGRYGYVTAAGSMCMFPVSTAPKNPTYDWLKGDLFLVLSSLDDTDRPDDRSCSTGAAIAPATCKATVWLRLKMALMGSNYSHLNTNQFLEGVHVFRGRFEQQFVIKISFNERTKESEMRAQGCAALRSASVLEMINQSRNWGAHMLNWFYIHTPIRELVKSSVSHACAAYPSISRHWKVDILLRCLTFDRQIYDMLGGPRKQQRLKANKLDTESDCMIAMLLIWLWSPGCGRDVGKPEQNLWRKVISITYVVF